LLNNKSTSFSIELNFEKKNYERNKGTLQLLCLSCLYFLGFCSSFLIVYYIITLRVHCDILKSASQFTPSIILLYVPSSFLRILSIGLIFLFSYMNTKYFHHIHPATPFFIFSPPIFTNTPTGPFLPSYPLFFKKDIFVCLRYLQKEFH
jgi:hypothetical protein